MKKINMMENEWMTELLDYIREQVSAVTESDFFIDTDEDPEHEGSEHVELLNIRFPFRIFEPCRYEPEVVNGFSGLFGYIKNYEQEIDTISLFENEWGEKGIRYKPVLCFQSHQDFGSEPEKQPMQWATVRFEMMEV